MRHPPASILFLVWAGCGAPDPQADLPQLTAEPEAPACAIPTGTYKAQFTLRDTEGDCAAAKPQSYDPISFDEQGRFASPLQGVVSCATVQEGCQLAVRCDSSALGAKASLDAELSLDGTALGGIGIVEGSYRGCLKVTYYVAALREGAELPAP